MVYIVSHVSPDFDAIASLWLLQRFGPFADADIKLVNTGSPDAAVLEDASAVVDTGRVLDPSRWRFDHHQFAGAAANATCAAMQVWQYLLLDNQDLFYLQPLILLIYAGDTGKPEAAESRRTGIHALLSAEKASGSGDLGVIAYGYDILDNLAAHLRRAHEAREALAQHTAYRSADGLLIALEQSSRASVSAAYDAGARLVLWHRTFEATETVELWRGGEGPDVDCGRLVKAVLWASAGTPVWEEVSTWYRHSAGFYAGRGSDKAPDLTPLNVPVASIAAALDAAWER